MCIRDRCQKKERVSEEGDRDSVRRRRKRQCQKKEKETVSEEGDRDSVRRRRQRQCQKKETETVSEEGSEKKALEEE